MSLLEPDVRDLGAVAGVPAQRRPPEPAGVVDQRLDELGERDRDSLRRLASHASDPRVTIPARWKRLGTRTRGEEISCGGESESAPSCTSFY
jgi:hypothetical protein